MAYSSDVLIVGAGIGGLSLGLRLAAKGCRVRVLQPYDSTPPVRRPEMVQPAGLQAFADLGLLDRLQAKNVARVDRFYFSRIGGGRLCQVDYRVLDHPCPYALITLPSQILDLLLERAASAPVLCIHRGARFTGVLRRGGQVTGVKAVEGGQEEEFYARVTVGADGRGSRLREALGIACTVKQYRNDFLGLLVERPAGCDGAVHYYLGEGEILGRFPCAPALLCLLFMFPAGGLPAKDEKGLAAVKSRISAIDPGIEDALKALTGWEQVSRLTAVRVRAASWVTDGAVLMGDAAHACHPHVAQGSFQAMEDGRVLAEVLDACLKRGEYSARALAPYERIRRPVVERLQQVANEYVWLWETKNPMLARLRDRIFRNIGEQPDLLRKVAATEAGIDPRPLTFRERLRAVGLCA
ncbi:MAG: FAD-dependent monooxygenase [Nitrospirae bacterium]|nr:FAD-dependent monooxygenase [Nitrospirota bacterium]